MDNMVKWQRSEIVRLKEENVALRNAALKLIRQAKENRAVIQVQREVANSLHGRLTVANAAFDVLMEEFKE